MFKIRKRMSAGVLAAALALCAAALPVSADYDDMEELTRHVTVSVPQTLHITRPEKDVSVNAEYYYLTGSSDPKKELLVNGEAAGQRGQFGSWGVWAALQPGENVFTLQNGAESSSVTITRGAAATVAATKTITQQTPQFDAAVRAGNIAVLSCTAPSGATVWAQVNGSRVNLTQKNAASGGVPAVFQGEYTMPESGGVTNLGKVTYTLSYNGSTSTYDSDGALFSVGEGETLLVRVKDTSATIFTENSAQSNFLATAKAGGVDYVEEIGDTMYKLGMGGWILQKSVQPLSEGVEYRNKISDVSFSADGRTESYVFSGTGSPLFTAYQDGQRLSVTFAHTSGVGDVPTEGSTLFSDVRVSSAGGDTKLDFMLSGSKTLWGYLVEYDGAGNTTLTCKYKPKLAPGDQPLKGITVTLDAGHGGNDTGALGIPNGQGPVEKDITLDTAQAVKKRLEKLGATVLMTRDGDSAVDLSQRLALSEAARADFFIALHCNSTAVNINGLKPNGVEVYYYEESAKAFSDTILGSVTSATGRSARRSAYSNYKVTLSSAAPAILVELGFLTNPAEYDSLCSRQGMFQAANAVGDGIVRYLS